MLIFSKNMRCRLRCTDDSGIVLVVVLWVTIFLSTLVFIIGRGAQIEISFAKYKVAKAKTIAYVWSGLFFALDQLKKEFSKGNPETSMLKDQAKPVTYGHKPMLEVAVDRGYFRITPPAQQTSGGQYVYSRWFQDEADRINLNGLTASNCRVFQELLVILGVQESVASDISKSVVDWKDADHNAFDQGQGKEDDFYMAQAKPYRCKNRPFDSVEELLLVKGMTMEIFKMLEPYITVFPQQGELRINFETAPEAVLLALARSASGSRTNTDISDANGLVKKILDYRNDFLSKVSDNGQKMDFNNMKLDSKERAIYFTLISYKAPLTETVRFDIQGVDMAASVDTRVEVIVDLQKQAILSWQREGN